jgi:mannose-1-phosphate guanylyltransferase / phosphomannomutase
LLRNMEPVFGLELPGYWCDAGDLLQYRNAHFDALQGKLKLDLPAIHVGQGIWVGDGVDIHPTAQLSSPIYIGSGASIRRDARLGEHTIIGANAVVDEGAYVTRCVVGAGAHISRETQVSDCVIQGGYLVEESGTTGEPRPAPPKPVEVAPAAPVSQSIFV